MRQGPGVAYLNSGGGTRKYLTFLPGPVTSLDVLTCGTKRLEPRTSLRPLIRRDWSNLQDRSSFLIAVHLY